MDDKFLGLKIGDWIAIYAAIISSIVFFWNVIQSRPRLKIDLLFGVETIQGVTTSGASIIVRNTSSHDVHLGSIGLLYPVSNFNAKESIVHMLRYRRWPSRIGWCHTSLSLYGKEDGCPMRLEARKSHHVLVSKDIVEQILSGAKHPTLVAKVQDQLWNNLYSKPFKWPQGRS